MNQAASKNTVEEYQALAAGLPKYCPNAIFTVLSQTYSSAEAATFVNTFLNSVAGVTNARSALATARIAAETALAQDGPTVDAIRDTIALMFSNDATTLAAFNLKPKKPRQPLTAAARAAAEAKAAATRKARGTTGKKKKKAAITGGVTGVTITPITGAEPGRAAEGTTTATSAAPAAATSSSATAPAPATSVGASAPAASAATPAHADAAHS